MEERKTLVLLIPTSYTLNSQYHSLIIKVDLKIGEGYSKLIWGSRNRQIYYCSVRQRCSILFWFKLYFICTIYDKYTNNTEYDYNTTIIQMGFRRKSNDLFESVSQVFTLLIYVLSCRNCHLCREKWSHFVAVWR